MLKLFYCGERVVCANHQVCMTPESRFQRDRIKGFNTLYKKNTRGFTLIELLVVIAIIGVLASIVLASLNTARRKSRDARRLADVKQMQLALELYFDGNSSSYPLADTSLAPTYIPTLPKDPSLSTLDYNYTGVNSSGTACTVTPCTSYRLGATLAETTNPALNNDADSAVVTGATGNAAFSGLSASAEGVACSTTAGTPEPGGTETCYDVMP